DGGPQGRTDRQEGRHDADLCRRRQPRSGDGDRGGPVHGARGPDPRHARLRRDPARLPAETEERVEAGGRPVQEARDRAAGLRAGAPAREDPGGPGLPGRPDVDRRYLRAGRARGRGRHHEGQGLPGRGEAARLVRRRCDARLDVPPGPRLHRRLLGPVASLAGAPLAGPDGRRPTDRAERAGRARTPRAEPRARAGRGAGCTGRSRAAAQEREDDQGPAAEGRGGEVTMPQVRVIDANGQSKEMLELNPDVFGVELRVPLLHQAVTRELAGRRAGTADTRGRSEVSGGGKKPWRQKGTGRARQGSIRAPQWKGGGKPFGPTPRSYAQSMPRQARREALRA